MSFDGEAIAALAIFIVGLAIAERRKLKTKKRQKKGLLARNYGYADKEVSVYMIFFSQN